VGHGGDLRLDQVTPVAGGGVERVTLGGGHLGGLGGGALAVGGLAVRGALRLAGGHEPGGRRPGRDRSVREARGAHSVAGQFDHLVSAAAGVVGHPVVLGGGDARAAVAGDVVVQVTVRDEVPAGPAAATDELVVEGGELVVCGEPDLLGGLDVGGDLLDGADTPGRTIAGGLGLGFAEVATQADQPLAAGAHDVFQAADLDVDLGGGGGRGVHQVSLGSGGTTLSLAE
jgi:hypothetical protein